MSHKDISDLNLDKKFAQIPISLEAFRPLNKEEVCSFLHIERGTLEYYNARGLPRFKLGNEVRYYLPDVLNFFRSRDVNGKEQFSYEAEA